MSARHFCFVFGALVCACNAITGAGQYVTDCPNETCSAEDSGSTDGSTADGTTGADADAMPDAPKTDAVATEPCPSQQARVSITVAPSTSAIVIESRPQGLSVGAGHTASVCFQTGAISLRVPNGRASWSGVVCEGGNDSVDRCDFVLGASGVTIDVSLQP